MCTVADVELQSTPAIGKTTKAVLTVKSQEAVQDAQVTLSVNENFEVVSADGFSNARTQASGVGPVSTISRSTDLAAGGTKTYEFTLRAVGKGYGVAQARVKTGDARTAASDEDAVVVGEVAYADTGGYATEPAPENAAQAPRATQATYSAAPLSANAGPKSLSAEAPNASCAEGRWVFNNELGQQEGSENVQVEVWDQDSSTADDLLVTAVTGGNGFYNICFESTDGEGGGQEVYVKFITENAVWRVRNTAASNSNYVWTTGVIAIADPGTANFGWLQPADSAQHRALHAFDGMNLFWYWINGVSTYFDNPGQTRQVIINWTPTSTDGTYYSLGDNDIHLAAANPDSDHTTIHEGAHALMDAIYNDDFPPAPNCNPHSIFGTSSTGCAWTEGWAEWVPARALNDPFYRWDDGNFLNLETPGWTSGQAQGDAVEGRIAGTLIDLSDNANEAPWDRYGEAEAYGAEFEEIYATNIIQVSDTLSEYFLTDRPGEGDTGYLARTAVFANTINYTQRDPLFSLGELDRPSLSVQPSPHNYSLNTVNGYWSGVGIRGGNDNDITLYDDAAQSVSLGGSTFGGSTIDYMLIDSNERALGDYYPRAYLFSGSGAYDVEWAAGANILGQTSTLTSFGSGDVIKLWDAFADSGVVNYVRVVPSGGLDVEVLAHDSDSATASTFVQSRGTAVAVGSSGGAGAAEALQYSVATGDWTGIVLLNKGGSGTATIYRDQSAPTGASVEINGGAASTNNRDVNLALAASDAQTGMMDMRISVDGVFDTETWQPYSTSGSATVPTGAGTKTVTVQLRNNAGAISTASDTIDLVPTKPAAPTITDTSAGPGAGQATVTFTPNADGGDPITNFAAQCLSTDGGTPRSRAGSASPLTVTQLTPGKSYHCRVRATNSVGTGPYSPYGRDGSARPRRSRTAHGDKHDDTSRWRYPHRVCSRLQQRQPDHKLRSAVRQHRRRSDEDPERSREPDHRRESHHRKELPLPSPGHQRGRHRRLQRVRRHRGSRGDRSGRSDSDGNNRGCGRGHHDLHARLQWGQFDHQLLDPVRLDRRGNHQKQQRCLQSDHGQRTDRGEELPLPSPRNQRHRHRSLQRLRAHRAGHLTDTASQLQVRRRLIGAAVPRGWLAGSTHDRSAMLVDRSGEADAHTRDTPPGGPRRPRHGVDPRSDHHVRRSSVVDGLDSGGNGLAARRAAGNGCGRHRTGLRAVARWRLRDDRA